ncbi:hypothetical protein [Nocardia inohanensis]|uniref:hypothetical protein n=1 Tax=Nocardia inohanensis TaxID=209246 RepID=UPI000833B8A6|nr:hypothetical protein [Nocardia inohanensis]
MALAREAVAVRTAHAHGLLRGTPGGRTLLRIVGDMVRIQLVDRSLALASLIFTSMLPVIMAASTFSGWHTALDAINTKFGVESVTLEPDSTAAQTDSALTAFGVVGLLMVLISGTAFARGLVRMYTAIWVEVPALGARDAWRWMASLLVIAVAVALVGQTRYLERLAYAGGPLTLAAEFVLWSATWAWVPQLLTKGALSPRVLTTTGMLTGAALTAIQTAGRIVLPRTTVSAQQHFGPLGIAFTLVSWLFVVSIAIVAGATIVKALALDETRVGAFLRGPSATGTQIDSRPS